MTINRKNFLQLFHRIKGEDREKWIPVIQAHQEINVGKTMYICDLHFHPKDLIRNGNHLRPKKNVLPHFRYVFNLLTQFLFF